MNALFSKRQSGRRYLIAAVIAAALQTIILGYIIESRAAILRSGTEVLLKTTPVDPRDFLRGDYVVLNYEISSVPAQTVVGGLPTIPGEQTLWVRLKKQPDGFWAIVEFLVPAAPRGSGKRRAQEPSILHLRCAHGRHDPRRIRDRTLLCAGRPRQAAGGGPAGRQRFDCCAYFKRWHGSDPQLARRRQARL